MIGAGNQSPSCAGLFSAFTANDPQLAGDIDREKAQGLGLPISEITSAMQIYLGSQYVNDFDFNNRAYRVYVQADQRSGRTRRTWVSYYARTTSGEMVPLDSVVRVRETTAPAGDQPLQPVPLGDDQRIRGAGRQLRRGARRDGAAGGARLPQGLGYAWSGISLEETKAGGQSVADLRPGAAAGLPDAGRAVRELVLPFIVLLGVPLAVLGRAAAQWRAGLPNDVFCQIGLVMLIGLAAKNAILIVEFAEQLRGAGCRSSRRPSRRRASGCGRS